MDPLFQPMSNPVITLPVHRFDIKPVPTRVESPYPMRSYDEAQGRGEAPPHRPDLEQKYYYGNQGQPVSEPFDARVKRWLDVIPGPRNLVYGSAMLATATAVTGVAWAGARFARRVATSSGTSGVQHSWGKHFYEGPFEAVMTKKEASLILGCREHATKEVIMSRYRILMKANHPDMGGSQFLSTKVNEAKDLLAKSARSEKDKERR